MSDNYHPNGGIVAVSNSLDDAYSLLRKSASIPKTSDVFHSSPDRVYDIEAEKEEYFVFPNAGCC